MNPNLSDFLQETPVGMELCNKTFSGVSFLKFSLVGRDKPVIITDVQFDQCTTKEATTYLLDDVILSNVEFLDFCPGRTFRIDSGVQLNGVKFVGSKHPKILWIKPSERCFDREMGQFDHRHYDLDLTEHHGETIIVGVPVDRIKVDPNLHVKFRLNEVKDIVWANYPSKITGYWVECVGTIDDNYAQEGVFSFPRDTTEHCREVVANMREDGWCT